MIQALLSVTHRQYLEKKIELNIVYCSRVYKVHETIIKENNTARYKDQIIKISSLLE